MRVGTALVQTADSLTREVTAFGSFAEFEAAMDGGYVPTLREGGTNGRPTKVNRQQAEWNSSVRALRRVLLEKGRRYFDGRRMVSG